MVEIRPPEKEQVTEVDAIMTNKKKDETAGVNAYIGMVLPERTTSVKGTRRSSFLGWMVIEWAASFCNIFASLAYAAPEQAKMADWSLQ